MARPICVTCKVEMDHTKTGIVVYRKQGSRITMIAFGDLFSCSKCHKGVISNLGRPILDGDVTFPTQDKIKKTLSRRISLELVS